MTLRPPVCALHGPRVLHFDFGLLGVARFWVCSLPGGDDDVPFVDDSCPWASIADEVIAVSDDEPAQPDAVVDPMDEDRDALLRIAFSEELDMLQRIAMSD